MPELLFMAIGVLCGFIFGLWAAFNFFADKLPEKTVFKIDESVVNQLQQEMVFKWLDLRGLTWMPKGVDVAARKAAK